MKTLVAGAPVIYVTPPTTKGGKTSNRKAVILDPLGSSAALLDLNPKKDGSPSDDRNQLANAAYSLNGEENTFHFEDESDAVKANQKETPVPGASV